MTPRLVAGDPASLSRSGSAAQASARMLHDAGDHLVDLVPTLAQGWTERAARTCRAELDVLGVATGSLAAELEAVGVALQAHATAMADTIREARSLTERITAAGLRLDEGCVAVPLGPRGGATAATESRLRERQLSLQAELDLLRLRIATTRGQFRSLLRASQERVATVAQRARG